LWLRIGLFFLIISGLITAYDYLYGTNQTNLQYFHLPGEILTNTPYLFSECIASFSYLDWKSAHTDNCIVYTHLMTVIFYTLLGMFLGLIISKRKLLKEIKFLKFELKRRK